MKFSKTIAVIGLFTALSSTGALASNTRSVKDDKGSKSTGYTDSTGDVIKINGVNGVNGLTDESNTRSVNGRENSRD